MPSSQIQYHAYLLRIWQDIYDGQPVWRASLENAKTGERIGFATLTDLVQFLCAQTNSDTNLCNEVTEY